MIKVLGKATSLLAAVALAGCSAGMSVEDQDPTNTEGTGGVNFDLDIPNGESVDEILLHLVCADGIDQNHVLDVVDGEVVASFGGLTPGQCTATMTSQTPEGTDCIGEETFTVVDGVTTPVTITLMCQGVNDTTGGTVKINTEFETKECNVDRIKKIWAIPANLLEGESTTVEVEVWPGTLVETASPATWSFEVVSGTGPGSVSSAASCTAESCSDFTCGDIDSASPVDPDTGLPTSRATILVTVEDDDCYDTETVYVDCGQASVCGDNVADGVEECDGTDGVGAGQECSSSCELEYCGDGLINVSGEVCDGTAGVGLNQHCDSSCQLVNDPYCGDNITNGTEECDGADLPYVGAVCDGSCNIVPFCGNGVAEGTEECDGTDGVTAPDTCDSSCVIVPYTAPNLCLDCMEVQPDVSADTATCQGDPTCNAMLECITSSGCYYPVPSDCYCGDGVDGTLCEGASYTPVGDCFLEMQAHAGSTVNATVLSFVSPALLAIDYAVTNVCIAECQF